MKILFYSLFLFVALYTYSYSIHFFVKALRHGSIEWIMDIVSYDCLKLITFVLLLHLEK